jgi:hypothetical protein
VETVAGGEWRTRRAVVIVAVGAAYAGVAASTTPFSLAADVVTGLPIVALAVMVLLRWPLHPRPPPRTSTTTATTHPWLAWGLLALAVVAWELAEYAARGSRAAHPTFSSMTDAVDRYGALKAVMFLLWLGLGAAIVRSGRRGRRDRRHRHAGRPTRSRPS